MEADGREFTLAPDEIVTAIRHAYITRHGQPMWQRILFRTILSDSKKLETAARMALWAKRSGLATVAEKTGILNLVDKRLQVANQVVPPMTGKPFLRGGQAQVPTPDKVKHRVGYFASCGFSFQFPEVVEATLRVLARNGCAITVLDNTCCGRRM